MLLLVRLVFAGIGVVLLMIAGLPEVPFGGSATAGGAVGAGVLAIGCVFAWAACAGAWGARWLREMLSRGEGDHRNLSTGFRQ